MTTTTTTTAIGTAVATATTTTTTTTFATYDASFTICLKHTNFVFCKLCISRLFKLLEHLLLCICHHDLIIMKIKFHGETQYIEISILSYLR